MASALVPGVPPVKQLEVQAPFFDSMFRHTVDGVPWTGTALAVWLSMGEPLVS